MTVILKNERKFLVNLGVENGKMLVFNPEEQKEISDNVAKDFEHKISTYVKSKILSVVKVSKPKATVVKDESTKPVVKEAKTKKKVSKK